MEKKAKIKIIPPKKPAFTIETADDFFRLHTLCIASATRGSGKSTSIINLVREAMERGYYDRVLVITPTFESNRLLWDLIPDLNEDDVFEPEVSTLKKIKDIIQQEREEWDLFNFQKEMYEKFHKDIKHKPIKSINPEELIEYYEMGLLDNDAGFEKPVWKYQKEVPPRLALIIDDCMGTDIMTKRSAGLTKFIIAHRHWGKGLGISVFMLVQSYSSHENLARPIRENTCILMLWKIKDKKQRDKIIQEAGLDITEQQFLNMLEHCLKTPFGFLTIDFQPKKPEYQFRKQFDTFLNPDDFKEEKKEKENIDTL